MAREKKKPEDVRNFDDWYQEHKAELSKKRKAKYAKNKEYRNSIKERTARKYREANGIMEDGARIVKSKGRLFIGYKLADAADMLDINLHTLRWYLSSGYLPTFEVDNSSLRIITVDQMPLVATFLSKSTEDSVGVVAKQMKSYLNKNWGNRDGSKEIINQKK